MYKCIKAFIAKSGNHFRYGEKLSQYAYSRLNYDDQQNFTQEADEDTPISLISPLLDLITPNLLDSSPSSTPDSDVSSSSFDFGGGDSGGGGASGDF